MPKYGNKPDIKTIRKVHALIDRGLGLRAIGRVLKKDVKNIWLWARKYDKAGKRLDKL